MSQISRRQFGSLALALAHRPFARAAARGTSAVDDTLRSGIAGRKIPAAVGMFANASKTLYSGAFGTRDSSGVPVKLDSLFNTASMTKAVTSVAALQLVEQGKITLDEPVSRHLPKLGDLKVLNGFDPEGKARFRPAKTPVTLRHLLSHTSGFAYDTWDADAYRYLSQPGVSSSEPVLMFDPGTRWQYGTGVDWAGRLVEKVSGMSLEEYFQAKIFRPLEMLDTSYLVPESKYDRLVAIYQRLPDGTLRQNPRNPPTPPKEFNGGGGLYSTAADYVRFMQIFLGKGRGANKARILDAKTVQLMETNQIGSLTAGKMNSNRPDRSANTDFQPGVAQKWGLGFLINTAPHTGGRSAGSLAWGGLLNTFFWIDPKASVCGTLLMQYLPFVDKDAMGLLDEFERACYSLL